ncbi:nucleoid occlusion factor SlmA, partial [Escherichia coli]|nr:nucleoid occlusion factor SlmA [Escherichia coli]
EQQQSVKQQIADLLNKDWREAINNCEALLSETSSTLRELQDTLQAASDELQTQILDIQEIVYGDPELEFIEEALMTRINRILDDEKDTLERIRMVMHLILAFSERNPGLTRILSGHALMFENERLRERINQLFERIETQLRQILRERKIREGKSFPVEE